MTYQEFLSRVREQGGLSSTDETARVVTATLQALSECLAAGGADALPQEIRQLVPASLLGGAAGQLDALGGGQSANPQLAGETRAESGGESTAESGQ